jgi:hypothetical protein
MKTDQLYLSSSSTPIKVVSARQWIVIKNSEFMKPPMSGDMAPSLRCWIKERQDGLLQQSMIGLGRTMPFQFG